MKKRLLALLLCVSMIVSLVPSAFAADEANSTTDNQSNSRSTSTIGDALKLSKTSVYNSATGLYDVALESYTTGVIEEGQILPADTVLVLDTSGSMAYNYKLTRPGTPMYGDYFSHSSGNYWGWLLNGHLVNGKNPYVLLPNGTFAEAEYYTTDANNVEVFKVKSTGELFYPTLKPDSITTVPRVHDYPVYQLYSTNVTETYTVQTGVPMFGSKFTYSNVTYYGWLQDTHGEPYIRLADGSFERAYYSRTDSRKVEIFKYTDADTKEVFEFYPRLVEADNNVTRAENLPVVQLYSGYNSTRMAALHDAVAEFLRLTAEKNKGVAATAQSRVAIVQFSCDVHGGTAPTKVLKNPTAITASNVDEWIAFTYGITDGGAHTHTEIGEGMLLAENILSGITRTSHKAVIAFTDGKPECDVTSGGGFSYTETDKAIAAANRMISTMDADVYAICIQDHAKVNAGAALPPNEGKGVNDDKNNINRFMHLMSSNYPDATDMTNTGTGSTSAGYYMVPGGDIDLVGIFTQIGDQIGDASINLGTSATVLDYVTPYFTIPAGAVVDISVEDAVYNNGALTWKPSTMDTSGISYEIIQANKSVKVTGFDYNHNFVAEQGREEGNIAQAGSFHGRKLVIKFSIDENPDFLGGDNVVTNETASGIYSGGGLVAAFPVPEVNVPLKEITPAYKNGNIYISQAAELPHIANIGKFSINGTSYEVDGINNDYVDIVYTITDGASSISFTIPHGTKLEDLNVDNEANWTKTGNLSLKQVLTEDKTYTLTCLVKSINLETNKTQTTASPTISVYKPEVTFKDSYIRLGETADYDVNNYVSVVWKHGDTVADETQLGKAPTLSYTYSPQEGAFKADTPVNVTKVISPKNSTLKHDVPADMDIIDHTTFYRAACDFSKCDHDTLSKVTGSNPNFIVHLLRFDLVIGKDGIQDVDHHAEVADVTNAEWQSTIFTVSNAQTGFSMDVTIHGNDSVKILDLPAATTAYTVTEKTDWSWRYDPEGGVTKEVPLVTEDGKTVEVEFENERTISKWLNGDFWTQNIFKSGSTAKTGNGQ